MVLSLALEHGKSICEMLLQYEDGDDLLPQLFCQSWDHQGLYDKVYEWQKEKPTNDEIRIVAISEHLFFPLNAPPFVE